MKVFGMDFSKSVEFINSCRVSIDSLMVKIMCPISNYKSYDCKYFTEASSL